MTSSTNFVDYLNKEIIQELENLYGENFAEILDYEMRKYVERVNKRYKYAFGVNANKLNQQLSAEGLLVDMTEEGYLYGNDITKTWDWYNAEYFNDEETMKELLNNKEIYLAKLKADFIKNHITLVLPIGLVKRLSGKFVNNAIRKNLIKTNNLGLDEKKILGFDWM